MDVRARGWYTSSVVDEDTTNQIKVVPKVSGPPACHQKIYGTLCKELLGS
jgi:hypothetical protein